MPEAIDDLLMRLRKQDYQIALTPENKISAKPPAGTLPDHIRAILVARRDEVVAQLQAEGFEAACQGFRAAVFRMAAEYEARKPLTRAWAEGRELVDIWYGVMAPKTAYDAQDTAAVQAAATQLDGAVAAYFRAFDARTENVIPLAQAVTAPSAVERQYD